MNEFFKKLLENIKNIYSKISLVQKIIAGGIILLVIIVLIALIIFNTRTVGVPLFTQKIDIADFGAITKKLEQENINFTTRDNEIILVKDQQTKNKVIMMLAQNGTMPKGKYTFLDIIESKKLTSSKFENDIKLRAALEGKLEELLRTSDLIDDADVTFTMPQESVFVKERSPVKVAVMLKPAWRAELRENRNAIKGIEELIVNSIDKASKENVVITDENGIKLNDWTEDEMITDLKKTKENLKIKDEQTLKYRNKILEALTQFFPEDRISVLVDVQMNFDKESKKTKKILPVVLKEDDPATPYDDGERTYNITESSKTVKETFKGPNWIPEGPPGMDDNVSPAYKGALEQTTEYEKEELIENKISGEDNIETTKDPWEITKITASVTIDGTWSLQFDESGKIVMEEDNKTRKRKYLPVSDEELKKVKEAVEQGIGYSIIRGDKVVVNSLPKDRSKEFAEIDEKWRRRRQTTYALFAGLIALILLILAMIGYRLIAKEIERRKRLREEELARQHQLAREMALKSAEEEGNEIEMSLEDKTRLEMQENAINLAREHPEDVAQLIRTWLTEE